MIRDQSLLWRTLNVGLLKSIDFALGINAMCSKVIQSAFFSHTPLINTSISGLALQILGKDNLFLTKILRKGTLLCSPTKTLQRYMEKTKAKKHISHICKQIICN